MELKALVFALMTWAAAATGLPVPAEAPGLGFLSKSDLCTLIYISAQRLRSCKRDGNIRGVYFNDRIYLYLEWDQEAPIDRSGLIHELVHYLQDRAKTRYLCPEAAEKVAYDIQITYLREVHGLDYFELGQMNRMFYHFVTTCKSED